MRRCLAVLEGAQRSGTAHMKLQDKNPRRDRKVALRTEESSCSLETSVRLRVGVVRRQSEAVL
jgi:hypothetical protein